MVRIPTVRTIILLTSKDGVASDGIYYSQPLPVDKFEAVRHRALPVEQAISDYTYTVSRKSLANTVWSFTDESGDDVLAKIRLNSQRLFEYCNGRICMGVKSGLTDAFVIDAATKDNIIRQNPNAQAIIKPFLNGRDIRRYHIDSKNAFFIYTYHGVNISDYPAVESHLLPFKERLEKRATKQEWYELQQPQLKFSKYMEEPKIIFPDIAVSPRFALDDAGHYSSNTTYFIALRDLYLLGLLNSSLGYFYFIKTCAGLEGKTETYLRFLASISKAFRFTPSITPTALIRHGMTKWLAWLNEFWSCRGDLLPQRRARKRLYFSGRLRQLTGKLTGWCMSFTV
jgi:hypothetical protein